MSDNERITDLEIKLTHQERLLEDLNQVIIEQAEELDALRRAVDGLTQHAASDPPAIGPGDEKPPHY